MGDETAAGPAHPAGAKSLLRFQSDGRYSSQNKFPAFTGELPNGDQFYGFPSEKDALKIGKHNGGQVISSAEERKPYGAYPQDGSGSLHVPA